MWQRETVNLVAIAAGSVVLVIFIILSLWIIVKILRLGLRWLRWAFASGTGDPIVNFVCFAVAAYWFPNPLDFLATATWNFITGILSFGPSQVQQQLTFFQGGCASSACLTIALINLSNAWSGFLSNTVVRVNIANFPFIDAIQLTAVWLGLARVWNGLSSFEDAAVELKRLWSRTVASLRAVPLVTRMNILFFAVLLVSAYLSLIAIIAIPSLQEPEVSNKDNVSNLKQRLSDATLNDAVFDARFPAKLNLVRPGQQSATAPDPNVSLLVTSFGGDFNRRFDTLDQQWTNLRENFRRDQSSVADLSTEIFELSNNGRKGAREMRQHMLNIELWYHRWWAQRAGRLTQCESDMQRFGATVNAQFESLSLFSAMSARLSSASASPPSTFTSIPTEFLNESSKQVARSEADAMNSCAERADVLDIPAREDFGGFLGVFGLAARWLLKTESLSLVLITGLLGFGLLGAACSTVIRNVPTRSRGEPLVPNLAGIVIRGTSAAILIFLAVFGGLAVFSGEKANPNPYVVLFTCLAAAVFSEDAWAWGAQQFRSRLTNASRTPLNRPNRTGSQRRSRAQ